MRLALNPRQTGVEALVLHAHAAPGLQADRLTRRHRDFTKHLDPQELASFLLVPASAAFATLNLPHLGHERARQGFVAFEQVVDVSRQVADGGRSILEAVGHQRAQTEAARVILHPPGLECGVLAVVAEDEQARPLRVVHHVLRQHVDVSHVGRTHGTRRLAIRGEHRPAVRAARQTTRQVPRIVFLLSDRVELHHFASGSAVQAARANRRMCRSATATHSNTRQPIVLFEILVGVAPDDVVDEDETLAALCLLERFPEGGIAAGLAAPGSRSGELEVLEKGDEVMLPAGGAGRDLEVGVGRVAAVRLDLVFGGEPQPRDR